MGPLNEVTAGMRAYMRDLGPSMEHSGMVQGAPSMCGAPPQHPHGLGAGLEAGSAPSHVSRGGRARAMTIVDHAAVYEDGLHQLLSLGIVFVMVDCPGFASEFMPVLVTRVMELDPSRDINDLPSSNIRRWAAC